MRAAAEGLEQQRIRCGELRDVLRDFAHVHVRIDTPDRAISVDTPDWMLRLRKMCLHVLAISECNVDVEGVHSMATELRAAYRQMHAVWPCVPAEHRMVEIGCGIGGTMRQETGCWRGTTIPTPVSLMFPLRDGGFDKGWRCNKLRATGRVAGHSRTRIRPCNRLSSRGSEGGQGPRLAANRAGATWCSSCPGSDVIRTHATPKRTPQPEVHLRPSYFA